MWQHLFPGVTSMTPAPASHVTISSARTRESDKRQERNPMKNTFNEPSILVQRQFQLGHNRSAVFCGCHFCCRTFLLLFTLAHIFNSLQLFFRSLFFLSLLSFLSAFVFIFTIISFFFIFYLQIHIFHFFLFLIITIFF